LLDGKVEPIYTSLKGWNADLTKIRTIEEFPQELSDYIAFIEKEMEIPITYVSVGPDREQTIVR
jgi:adenylosuccinate synthase